MKRLNSSKSIDIPSVIREMQLLLTFEQFVFVYELIDEFIEQINVSSSSIEQQFYSIVEHRKRTDKVSVDPTYLHVNNYFFGDFYHKILSFTRVIIELINI